MATTPANPSLSLSVNRGRITEGRGTWALGVDAEAKTEVIISLVDYLLEQWPKVVYSDQVKNLVRKNAGRNAPS